MQVETFDVADVRIGSRLRQADPAKVEAIAASISTLGLRTPITVRVLDDVADEDGVMTDGVPFLVAGLHRLEAARSLGWTKIQAIVSEGDETDARLWEIAENLHRADLLPVERAEQIDEWRRLTLERVRQVGAPSGGNQPTERGHRKTAEALGVKEQTVRRAEKIASLPEEVREQARVEEWSQDRLLRHTGTTKPAPAIKNAFESEEDWRRALFTVWNRGAQDWRERALETLDEPTFERTSAGRG